MPLAFLSGLVPMHKHWDCVDIQKDLCYFGIRSYEEDEAAMIQEKGVLVFDSADCTKNRLDMIHSEIHSYFKHKQEKSKYWISFDIDGIDSEEFKSTGTDVGHGLTLDFTYALFERLIPQTVGMDFTEVNFELTSGATRVKDEETFRNVFEFICHQVNQPVFNDSTLKMPSVDINDKRLDKI
jgi:arginase family enzyme